MLKIKRAYAEKGPEDGKRILVDRLWPRGVNRQKAGIDEWRKEIAPTTELRQWFAHQPEKWSEFQKQYKEELLAPDKTEELNRIARIAKNQDVTLVYAAKDTQHNNARVLMDIITRLI